MVNKFIEQLRSSPDYNNEIVHQETINPTAPEHAPFPSSISALLKSSLKRQKIKTFYRSQREVLECLRCRENSLLTGGSASGKTTAVHCAVLEECLTHADSNALYILPTRALVTNQYFMLQELLQGNSLSSRIFVYDSRTSQRAVSSIRENARIVLTTPDTLHGKILPAHVKWAKFLSHVQVVCSDDIHAYRGIYGTQCALLFRRLRRILTHYQTKPFYVTSSIPIDQPLEHVQKLFGMPFHEIYAEGSTQGAQTFVFWNCATTGSSAKTMKALLDACAILIRLINQGTSTIVYTKSWSVSGLLYYHTGKLLEQNHPHLLQKIRHYRGGFLASVRDEIEQELFRGSLSGVITTNALEVGVDLKGINACIILGYPGTVSSVRQMAGRVGRDAAESLVIFMGYDTPINQYIMKHPEYMLNFNSEKVLINPANAYALSGQLGCTAYELPLPASEAETWSVDAVNILEILQQEKVVTRKKDTYFYSSKIVPSRIFNLRSLGYSTVRLEDINRNETIGFVDEVSALSQLYPGAIYFHGDSMYRSQQLDLEKHEVHLREVSVDYYTEAVGSRGVRYIDAVEESKDFSGGRVNFGEVTVYSEIRGYNKVDLWSGGVIEECPLDAPPRELKTTAFWLEPAEALTACPGNDAFSTVYGVGHALMFTTALSAHCAPLDVRDSYGWDCLSTIGKYALFIFDNFPGGIGYAESAFKEIDVFLKQCHDFIRNCFCSDGCPSCVGYQLRPVLMSDPSKGEGTLPRKVLALQWLGMFLGLPEYKHLFAPAPEKSHNFFEKQNNLQISSLTRENLKKKFLKRSG